ncbi:hypothetical protein [Variovorax sp. dw_954]|nr:hypothetical protein [Variovorax sp. dw_954]
MTFIADPECGEESGKFMRPAATGLIEISANCSEYSCGIARFDLLEVK